jgi:hypothetical protein
VYEETNTMNRRSLIVGITSLAGVAAIAPKELFAAAEKTEDTGSTPKAPDKAEPFLDVYIPYYPYPRTKENSDEVTWELFPDGWAAICAGLVFRTGHAGKAYEFEKDRNGNEQYFVAVDHVMMKAIPAVEVETFNNLADAEKHAMQIRRVRASLAREFYQGVRRDVSRIADETISSAPNLGPNRDDIFVRKEV